MAITDKTRKALWAKSGNRCLICRIELVQEANGTNDKLIIGEECHIISSKPKGPRSDPEYKGDYDHVDNLVLLCANDHKRIDELAEIYTVDKLKMFKEIHEDWIKSTLEKDTSAFTNDKSNIRSLAKITKGKQLMDLVYGAHLYEFDYDDLQTEEEATFIGGLFEELKDFGDILPEIGHAEVAKLGLQYNEELDRLKQMGFVLFGLRRKTHLLNSQRQDQGVFEMSTIIAVRQDNPAIVGDFLITKFEN